MNAPFTEEELNEQIANGTATADTYYLLGMKTYKDEYFLRALELDPNHADAWLELARNEITDPEIKNPNLALQHINKAIELNPSTQAYQLRALLYAFTLNQSQKALEDVEAALKLKPEDPDALDLKELITQEIADAEKPTPENKVPLTTTSISKYTIISIVSVAILTALIVYLYLKI